MSTVTHDVLKQKMRHLEQIVNISIENPDALDPVAVQEVLDRAETEIERIQSQRSNGTFKLEVSEVDSEVNMDRYFPIKVSPRREVPEGEVRQANGLWQEAVERGRRHVEDAKAQVGPLLTPGEAVEKLGVSNSTINSWRRQNKLLGLRFDKHQYLYPLFQFDSSSEQNKLSVRPHLDEVLAILGDRGAWEKAKFFLTPSPFLNGETPLDLLSAADSNDDDSESVGKGNLSRVRKLARHAGEMGS